MGRRLMAALLFLVLLLPAARPASAGGVRAVDGQGARIELAAPARRILCLYGAFSELYLAMGLGDRLVGRTMADETVPGLAALPSVGTHMRPSLELVLGLRPDLVVQLAGRSQAAQAVAALREHGLTVAVYNPRNFEELFQAVQSLGALAGAEAEAGALTDSMRARLDAVASRLGPEPGRPRVFFEVRAQSLLAAGRGGIVDDVIRRAGGENAVDSSKKMVRLGEEAVYGLDPDVYVVQSGAMNKNPLPPAERPLLASLPAVRRGRVLTVDEGLYSRPGPNAVRAVEELAEFLHPGR
ncbi:ABC transporter substrate-binding protein [Desulfocurvus sp. DL9XJH121]